MLLLLAIIIRNINKRHGKPINYSKYARYMIHLVKIITLLIVTSVL